MKKIKFRDGRILAYEEYGNPKGKPIFYFHGWPASRLSGKHLNTLAKKLNVRIISPDRPGLGRSTFQPGRTLLDWPKDLEEIAYKLGISKIVIIGSSGGAPYALACAYILKNKVDKVVIASGAGPFEWSFYTHESFANRIYMSVWKLLWFYSVPLLFISSKLILNYAVGRRFYFAFLRGDRFDKSLIDNSDFQKIYADSQKEAYHQGFKGPYHDLKILKSSWKSGLNKVKCQVIFYHGAKDKQVPVWMMKAVANKIEQSEIFVLPDKGHMLLASIPQKILKSAL